MRILLLVCTLILSMSSFSQSIMNCFDAREIADGGSGFHLKQTASGLAVEVYEMTFAGQKTIAEIEQTKVMRTDYSKISPSINACSLAVTGKQETEFGHKEVRVNVFQHGFVGMSVKEYVVGYLHCSYLQSKDSDIICNPGGGDNLILVDEYVQTTKNLAYAFTNKKHVKYTHMNCVENDFSMLISDHLNCDDQTDISVKIDL